MAYLRLVVIMVLVIGNSCNNSGQSEREKIMNSWYGKTIKIAENQHIIHLNKNSEIENYKEKTSNKPYKILVYTDSIGCISCKSRLMEWKPLIAELDSLAILQKVDLWFYFHAKSKKDLEFLLRGNNFQYPVFFDNNNLLDKLNHFPKEVFYRCFLLDNNNRVLIIGNPTFHENLWKLYKQVISDSSGL